MCGVMGDNRLESGVRSCSSGSLLTFSFARCRNFVLATLAVWQKSSPKCTLTDRCGSRSVSHMHEFVCTRCGSKHFCVLV